MPAAVTYHQSTRRNDETAKTQKVQEGIEGRERSLRAVTEPGAVQGPLFPDVTKGGLRHAWERTRDAAGLEDVRFHDLRHTYAVHCAKAGMPLVELQQRLGHATTGMTMRYAVYSPPVVSTHHRGWHWRDSGSRRGA